MVYPLKRSRALYIDGAWSDVAEGAVEAVINPATEEVIGHAPKGGIEEANFAIAAARRAFDQGPWPRLPAVQRVAKLRAFLDVIADRTSEILPLIVAEVGSPAVRAPFHIHATSGYARYMLDRALSDPVKALPLEVNSTPCGQKMLGGAVVVRAPIGVVSAITPFNLPFLNIVKIIPAMAVGNTVILKPSPYTPFEALILGEIADEVGLPAGVLNIVTGGQEVGFAMTTDPRVDLISFTGSDQVGSALQAQAGPTLKRLLLELGGKSALIVRPDADLDAAARAGANSFVAGSGQGCLLTTRHLVHNSIRAAYVERVAAIASAAKIGDPADPSTVMGPLIRAAQRARTESYVAIATAEGARLVTGGRRPPHLDKGFFYEPTLFDGVDNSWRIAQEEVFGPVAVVIGFDSDEEAVAIANTSQYGLHGGIYSADVGRAYEMALQVQTGYVAINGGSGGLNVAAPFGGIKRSGYGREYGEEGLAEFTYQKSISYHAA
jgi:acyl-CoA reductase-like NAD-dependent aldehyde dehydrogenase